MHLHNEDEDVSLIFVHVNVNISLKISSIGFRIYIRQIISEIIYIYKNIHIHKFA